ncbi:MAG: metallophosphoesterase [Desulfovibrio sp.]|nr:metallophosphoesterase [Desulfovibrio sp.]
MFCMAEQERHWLVLGDIHDCPQAVLSLPELGRADGILVTGDLTNTGGVSEASRVFRYFEKTALPVLAQFGNMDRKEVDDWLTRKGVNLHRTVWKLLPDVAVFGVGASLFTPFGTPSEYPESDFSFWLEECWQKAQSYPSTVLVSHNPPFDTACDIIADGSHVGSEAVKEFIEEHQPDICLCGHIHESRALDRIGRTLIVNPGSFAHGFYAMLHRDAQGKFSVDLHCLKKVS